MTMLDVYLRPFAATDADYETLIAIDAQAWPGEPLSKAVLQDEDASWNPTLLRERFIAERDRKPVAYLYYSATPWAYEPDKYFLKIMVLPTHQRQGIGRHLYDFAAEQLTARRARLFTATTREDQPQAVRFLERRGFVRVIRELESRLDVAAFDPTRFQPELKRAAQEGVRIYSLSQMRPQDPDWLRKWWELTWTIVPDMPTSESFTRESLEDFAAGIESPGISLDAAFVAVDAFSGQWVGMSRVRLYPEDPDMLYVGSTGVIRAYRRRGIALALKVHTIAFAQSYGAEVIIGENEENNPMYELNRRLGFVYSHARLGFAKPMPQAT